MATTWNEQQLKEAVLNSTCYADVARNLRINVAGVNYRTIKKYIKLLGIDTSHFDRSNQMRGLKLHSNKSRLPSSLVFKKCSHVAQKVLRGHVIRNKVIPYVCAKCDLKDEWNGKPLSLHLDHINGDNHDNRVENLRFLCPNCHSQTPTYSNSSNCGYDFNEAEKTELTCHTCKRTFERLSRDVKHKKKHRSQERFFCSDECSHASKNKLDHEAIYKRYLEVRNYNQVGREFGTSNTNVRKIVKKFAR